MATILLGSDEPLDSEFILNFGEALLEWSYVENRIYKWFHHLTGMSDRLARATFFSARSFAARAEMLSAVVDESDFKGAASAEARDFIVDAITKSLAYTRLRNAMAHGLPIRWVASEGTTDLLVQGKTATHLHATTGLTVSTFKLASKNFESLAIFIQAGLGFYRAEQLQQLQECHERLALLPNEPEKATPSQKQLGRLRQQRSVQRKKPHEGR